MDTMLLFRKCSHSVFFYTLERSETLEIFLVVGIEKRKHGLEGMSYSPHHESIGKSFSDSTDSPGLDSIFLSVLPIKRK